VVGPQPSEPADRSGWPRAAPVDAPRDARTHGPSMARPRFCDGRARRPRL